MTAQNAKIRANDKPQLSGLDLGGLGDLSSLLEPVVEKAAVDGPLHLPLDSIEEDPHQPRREDNPGFSKESLGELAATISERGVKSPISVRERPDAPGQYIINHGARRYRASRLAGKDTIPAFIDNDYNEADQVIENLQRNELTAREIADFIGRELAKGKKKIDVAKEIGKSPAFVTQHVTLLDLPEPIAAAFASGRSKDVTVVNELVTAYKKNPEEVGVWLADESQELTRGSVKLLREFLDDKRIHQEEAPILAPENNGGPNDGRIEVENSDADLVDDENAADAKKKADPEKIKKAIILVKHDERVARLLTNRRPPAEGWAWLKYESDGHEVEVELGSVQLMALMEG